MNTWAQRARAHFRQDRQNSTTETTEIPLSMVLTAQSRRFREKHDCQCQVKSDANGRTPMPAAFPEIQDGQPTPKKAQADSARGEMIDMGAIKPLGLSPALMAASLALDAEIRAAGALPGNDPDADCWPHSTVMNGTEIDLFTARLHRFTDKGLTRADGEALADMLVTRDREADDRQFCLECRYLSGYGDTSWRCGNWQAAGIAICPRDTQLPADLVFQLQRCDGFANAMPNAKTSAIANSIVKTPF